MIGSPLDEIGAIMTLVKSEVRPGTISRFENDEEVTHVSAVAFASSFTSSGEVCSVDVALRAYCAVAAAAVPADWNSREDVGCAFSSGVYWIRPFASTLSREAEKGTVCSTNGLRPGMRALMRIRLCPAFTAAVIAWVATCTVDSKFVGGLGWAFCSLAQHFGSCDDGFERVETGVKPVKPVTKAVIVDIVLGLFV